MSRLKALLTKTEQLLEGQWESFAIVDRWIQSEPSIPKQFLEEWKRIYEIQEFFLREHLKKLLEESPS